MEALPRPALVAEPWIQPQAFHAVALDGVRMMGALRAAPMEFSPEADEGATLLWLPRPDGTFERFEVVESPVMAPELAAQYPEIRTYLGYGLDDASASARLDFTPAGFHAQVLSAEGAYYVDPYWRGDTAHYTSYFKRDFVAINKTFECLTEPGGGHVELDSPQRNATLRQGETLRTYRAAIAANGEYTQFHGGTVIAGLAAVVTSLNRVTGIYETEVSVRMQLVANNNLIIYTNPNTDPYSNTNPSAMLSQNQSNLNSVIGSGFYDIGHVYSTGGGGIAGLGVVCRSNKASGVTGTNSPVGDPFDVDYVAHEMGHQFGGNHTFNGTVGSCSGGNRNGSTAYEPGSGSTIQAYAGICGSDNLQPNSDPFFHFISLQEINNYTQTSFGNTCAVQSSTGNNPPTVEAGSNYTIPAGTTFMLTATGSDPDSDPVTFCWEQRDLGPAQPLSQADNGSSPLFRSFAPTTSPSRIFPKLSAILAGSNSVGEKLPTTNRLLKFRVTARDNRAGGGGTAFDDMQLTVNTSSVPFVITAPTQNSVWTGTLAVQWNAGTTASAPFNAPTVNILLSTDGGQNFSTVLAAGTDNDGSEVVALPDMNTTTARIKVEAVGNVFLAISRGFTIESCSAPNAPLVEASPVSKVRYLSLQPNPGGAVTALRVRAVDLPPPFESMEGEEYWVGPSTSYSDVAGSFRASALQCAPYFSNWSGVSTVHVYSSAIVPGGTYEVQAARCVDGNEDNFSPPLSISTASWGDVTAPYLSGVNPNQPDFADVSAILGAFQGSPGSLSRPRAQLQPNTPNPNVGVNFMDVSACVTAFAGASYPYAGPSSCP